MVNHTSVNEFCKKVFLFIHLLINVLMNFFDENFLNALRYSVKFLVFFYLIQFRQPTVNPTIDVQGHEFCNDVHGNDLIIFKIFIFLKNEMKQETNGK